MRSGNVQSARRRPLSACSRNTAATIPEEELLRLSRDELLALGGNEQ
jgi:hypothetical protein